MPAPIANITDKRINSSKVQDVVESFPRTASQPLRELSPGKLNSPPKRTHQVQSASPEKRQMSDAALDNSVSSAKSEHLTSALSLMLAAKRAARPVSLPELGDAKHIRRKRSALGRATSASFEISQIGKSQIEQDAVELAEQGIGELAGDAPQPAEEFLLSQKITYEESEIRARKARLLAELGRSVDESPRKEVIATVPDGPPTRTRRKPTASTGVAAKPRARRKN